MDPPVNALPSVSPQPDGGNTTQPTSKSSPKVPLVAISCRNTQRMSEVDGGFFLNLIVIRIRSCQFISALYTDCTVGVVIGDLILRQRC